MAKANLLRQLKIREVSSVDRGAGEGVRVVLHKRAAKLMKGAVGSGPNSVGGPTARLPKVGPKRQRRKTIKTYLKRNYFIEAEAAAKVAKRTWSEDDRKEAAARGIAMPDGSYPIENADDFGSAVAAFGRAKKPGKTKAHIISRADALGLKNQLPAAWSKKKTAKLLAKIATDLGRVTALTKGDDAFDFEDALGEMSDTSFAEGVIEGVRDACHALRDSIESICEDDEVSDKGEMIRRSYAQFLDYLTGIAPGDVVKAMLRGVPLMAKNGKLEKLLKTYTSVGQNDGKSRQGEDTAPKNVKAKEGEDPSNPKTRVETAAKTPKKKLKALKKTMKAMAGDVKSLTKRADRAEARLKAALGLEKADKEYMSSPDNDMDEDDVKKFLDLGPADRKKFMEDRPLAVMTAKRIADLPADVRKDLEEGKAAAVVAKGLVEKAELVDFAKRAAEMGQTEEFAKSLRVVAKQLGTPEEIAKALEAIETVLKAQATQLNTSKLFGEFGGSGGSTGGTTAYDQLMSKAAELRKDVAKAGQPIMTVEQAFAKVYEDPANAELVAQHKADEAKRRAA